MHLCVNYHRYCYWKCANDATDGTDWYVVLAWFRVLHPPLVNLNIIVRCDWVVMLTTSYLFDVGVYSDM